MREAGRFHLVFTSWFAHFLNKKEFKREWRINSVNVRMTH